MFNVYFVFFYCIFLNVSFKLLPRCFYPSAIIYLRFFVVFSSTNLTRQISCTSTVLGNKRDSDSEVLVVAEEGESLKELPYSPCCAAFECFLEVFITLNVEKIKTLDTLLQSATIKDVAVTPNFGYY